MNDIRIEPGDDLRAVVFKVCTALMRGGVKVVLTGGSAASIYAPEVYQSRDADFLTYAMKSPSNLMTVLSGLGFEQSGGFFIHTAVPTTLDFLDEEIRIGSDVVERYETLEEDGLTLYILTPTDCVRDRLASFFWFHDRSALVAACGVSAARSRDVDLAEIAEWAEREGETAKYLEFLDRLARYESG
ncbi:MAG: hypothetical protein AKCLJLPJ_00987 [Fimbriimonadales bacterium]|nr:MAG: hypothetical protein EDM73_04660 [Armatimonadota bacterium]MBV6502931.1 hypothetical protein [Fimbriimonadales bacterium]MCE7899284.1 hypothetical protein [Armatimonadetes bacterium ATM1]MDL1927857.1 hypothetical protein [Fimbriimonadia bacterium ATM]MBC6969378.1 hypothetical protein [Armatimonadota bacterium]